MTNVSWFCVVESHAVGGMGTASGIGGVVKRAPANLVVVSDMIAEPVDDE